MGLLLLGDPGSGKSELALRLIDSVGYGVGEVVLRARLVADDQTIIENRGHRLYASAPVSISGRLEVRGIGVLRLQHLPSTELHAAVQLTAREGVERFPDLSVQSVEFCGLSVPLFHVAPFEIAATSKLRALAGDLMFHRNPQAVGGDDNKWA